MRGKLRVWVNGNPVKAGHHGAMVHVPLKGAVRAGKNVIAFAVEKRGAFGGVWRPITLTSYDRGRPAGKWEFSPALPRMPGSLDGGEWHRWRAGSPLPDAVSGAAFAWYRVKFGLPAPEGWHVAWKLCFECEGEARIYLNGEHVANWHTVGPQKEFYLPECYLKAGEGENLIEIAVRRSTGGIAIRRASVEPYTEYSVFRHRIDLPI